MEEQKIHTTSYHPMLIGWSNKKPRGHFTLNVARKSWGLEFAVTTDYASHPSLLFTNRLQTDQPFNAKLKVQLPEPITHADDDSGNRLKKSNFSLYTLLFITADSLAV